MMCYNVLVVCAASMFEPKSKCIMYTPKDTVICGSYSHGLHYPSVYTLRDYNPETRIAHLYNAPEIDFQCVPEGWGFSTALGFYTTWWQRKFVLLDVFLEQASPLLPYYNKLQEIQQTYGNYSS